MEMKNAESEKAMHIIILKEREKCKGHHYPIPNVKRSNASMKKGLQTKYSETKSKMD